MLHSLSFARTLEKPRFSGPSIYLELVAYAIYDRISSNIIELDDILQAIHYINKSIIIDDTQINELSEIIEHLEMLKRKYGGNMDLEYGI